SAWVKVDRLDFEGGAHLEKLQARIEDPFQLEGMNALGLPGAKIEGILGFSALARFRMEIDPTTDRMTWTRLDFEPPDLLAPRGGDGAPPAEIQAMNLFAPLAKLMALLIGKQPEERLVPRGSLGLELADDPDGPQIVAVLPGSAADRSGLKPGDRLVR